MASNLVVLSQLQNKLLPDIVQFRDFLRMVLPKTEEDKKLIKLFVDMLSEMITDIETATDLVDLKDWFRIGELVDDWDIVSNDLVDKYSTPVQKFIESITDSYIDGVTGGDGE